jgi:hypothetical protein
MFHISRVSCSWKFSGSSGKLVTKYQTIWCQNPGHCNLNLHCCEDLIFNTILSHDKLAHFWKTPHSSCIWTVSGWIQCSCCFLKVVVCLKSFLSCRLKLHLCDFDCDIKKRNIVSVLRTHVYLKRL